MKRILYILLGLSYIMPMIIIAFSFRKIYIIISGLIVAALSFAICNCGTREQMLISLIWVIWVLIFNIVTFMEYHSSKGTINIYENKYIMWGLYISFNVFMAVVRFFLAN